MEELSEELQQQIIELVANNLSVMVNVSEDCTDNLHITVTVELGSRTIEAWDMTMIDKKECQCRC